MTPLEAPNKNRRHAHTFDVDHADRVGDQDSLQAAVPTMREGGETVASRGTGTASQIGKTTSPGPPQRQQLGPSFPHRAFPLTQGGP